MKKWICLLLCFVLSLSVFAACAKGKNKEDAPYDPYEMQLGGESETHKNNSVKTDGFLVKDGKTSYKVLYPEDASGTVQTAVDELVFFFKEATGIALTSVSDADFDESGEWISVGQTKLFDAAGLEADAALLGESGARVLTEGKSVFLFGAGDFGTLYSVYEFLRDAFSYEFYTEDCYDLDTGVTELALYDYDILEIPDFQSRLGGWGYSVNNAMTKNRLRFRSVDDVYTPIQNMTFHNAFGYLPKETYQSAHPRWYADDGSQLCYTAHGDADEHEEMVSTVVAFYKNLFKTDPTATKISFTQADNLTWCGCSACKESNRKYNGANVATQIQFINEVEERMEAWLDTDEGKPYDRDYRFVVFAYHETNQPPTKEVNGEYVAIDDSVIPNEHVSVFFAETNADYTYSWEGDASSLNAMYRERLRAWSKIVPEGNLYWWFYSVCAQNYFTPYNCMDGYSYYYKLAKECGVTEVFNQADIAQTGPALGWGMLKGYLSSKLAWNINYNIDYLVEKFFQAQYGAGAELMKTVYEEWLGHSTYQRDVLGVNGSRSIFLDYSGATYWPMGLLERWIDLTTRAIEAVENEGGDREARYSANISVERACYEYLYLLNYGIRLSEDAKLTLQRQLKSDVLDTGVTMFSEYSTVNTMFSALGIE